MVESDAFWGVPLPNRRSMSLRHAGSHAVGAPPMRLELLGGFELRAQGRSVRPPLQVQRLLAFLALQGGRPLHRAYVAGRLWIDLSQDHAHASLRTTLWRMRRAGCPVVDVTSTHVAIAPSVTVDVHELEACAGRVLQADAPATSQDLYLLAHAEELLPDWYQDWVLQDRERLHQLRVVALEAAAEALIVVRRYADAAVAALAAVGADPLRESAYRLLIRSDLGDGNAAEALRHFDAFRADLMALYGLDPSPQMQELVQGLHARCG